MHAEGGREEGMRGEKRSRRKKMAKRRKEEERGGGALKENIADTDITKTNL